MLNFGTAVMGPEVYLKSAGHGAERGPSEGRDHREVHHGRVRPRTLGDDYRKQAPKTDPRYYFRP